MKMPAAGVLSKYIGLMGLRAHDVCRLTWGISLGDSFIIAEFVATSFRYDPEQ